MAISFYLLFDEPVGQQTSFTKHEALPKYKLSWQLLTIWVVLDILLLAAGITFIALSLIWWNPNAVRLMVLSDLDLFTGLVLGTLFFATFLFTIPTLYKTVTLSPRKVFPSRPHALLNLLFALDLMGVIAAGGIVWWRTLQERATFFVYWENNGEAFRNMLEDTFQCCGYFDQCPGSTLPVCVDPIQNHADRMLNAIFTSMFAMSAIIVSLILASACVIAELRVLDRFRRIDIKRGKFSGGPV